MNNEYVLVPWPESQEYMEYDWFQKEAILDVNAIFGSSAYHIPKERILEIADPDNIRSEIEKFFWNNMAIYGLDNIIDDIPEGRLTNDQKQWAKEHLTIKIDLI